MLYFFSQKARTNFNFLRWRCCFLWKRTIRKKHFHFPSQMPISIFFKKILLFPLPLAPGAPTRASPPTLTSSLPPAWPSSAPPSSTSPGSGRSSARTSPPRPRPTQGSSTWPPWASPPSPSPTPGCAQSWRLTGSRVINWIWHTLSL